MSNISMKKGLFLIGILLVPSVIYLLFSLGEHNTSRLEFFGSIESVSEEGDTVYASLPFPELRDQHGNEVDRSVLDGRVLVLDIFSNPCDESCSDKISTLNNYLNRIGLNDEWILLSIANGPMSQVELKELSVKNLYKGGNWHFASFSDDLARETFVNALFIETSQVKNESEIPTSKVALLDQNQKIRAFFDTRLQRDNKTLQDAIKLLIQEPHISWKEQ